MDFFDDDDIRSLENETGRPERAAGYNAEAVRAFERVCLSPLITIAPLARDEQDNLPNEIDDGRKKAQDHSGDGRHRSDGARQVAPIVLSPRLPREPESDHSANCPDELDRNERAKGDGHRGNSDNDRGDVFSHSNLPLCRAERDRSRQTSERMAHYTTRGPD